MRIGQREGSAGGIVELGVERGGADRERARDGGMIGVGGVDPEPAGGEPGPAETAAQPLGQRAKQRVQRAEIVGVGDEGVRQTELGQPLGRQHRTGVDPAGPRPQHPAGAAEDGAERALGDDRDLADEIELIVIQPAADAVGQLGQELDGDRREKSLLLAGPYLARLRAIRRPPFAPTRMAA